MLIDVCSTKALAFLLLRHVFINRTIDSYRTESSCSQPVLVVQTVYPFSVLCLVLCVTCEVATRL